MTTAQQLSQIEKHLIEVIKNESKEILSEIKQENLNFKDEILSEIKDLREEVQVVTSYRSVIADHESRISNLEPSTQP